MVDEAADLSATLAHEREHGDVGRSTARQHPEQRALSHAAPAEEADTLSQAAGQECIDGPHAGWERRNDGVAGHRIERRRMKGIFLFEAQRRAIERPSERIDDAAQETFSDAHRHRARPRDHAVAGPDAGRITERDREDDALAEAHHLHRERGGAGAADDLADLAHAGTRPRRLDQEPNRPHHAARGRNGLDVVHLVDVAGEGETLWCRGGHVILDS